MWKYIIKRILTMIPILICVAILIFTIMYFVPGDPAAIILGGNATQADIEALRENMGLNEPYFVRLGIFLKDTFLHLDLGNSYVNSTDVLSELLNRFPRTIIIAFFSCLISVVIGVPAGIYSAVHEGKLGDRFALVASMIGVAMPNFWLALLLVLLFALKLGWLPPSGIGGASYYVLPILATSFYGIATEVRQTRAAVLEAIRADYVTTARSKGVAERKVLYQHVLPNSLIPIITQAGGQFGYLLGGTLVIETIFAIPGIGTYMLSAINNRDYAAVQGSIVFLAFTFSVVILFVDVMYALVDPRIRSQYESGKRTGKERKTNG